MFGVLAMFLFVGYIASTRHFRRDMDVSTFMATICPIAAVAVVPLAIAEGDVFAVTGRGWTYILILAVLTGLAAHGWNVYAQKTIPIGTIGVAQVAQPALAVVWALLLLGEELVWGQLIGIAIVTVGLLAFILLNERGHRARRPATGRRDHPGGGGLGRGHVTRTAAASTRSRSVMKCDAVANRASACSNRSRAVATSPAVAAVRRQGVEREHLDVSFVVEARVIQDRAESVGRIRDAVGRIHRREQALAERGLLAAPALRDATRSLTRARPVHRAVRPSARSTRPRCTRASAARRTSPVASAFSIARCSVAAPVSGSPAWLCARPRLDT